jgi:AcrR family transcriptional regulator
MSAAPRPVERTGAADARLLAIASDHVRRFGSRRLTVVAVAEEAGMTHANVYRYFASKEALLDAVAGAALKPIERLLSDIAGAPDPVDDKLERMVLALARAYRDLLESDRPVFDLFAAAVEDNRGVARRHRGRVRTFVARVLDEGIAVGAFEPRDREAALSLLIDTFHRYTHPSSIRLDGARPRGPQDQRLSNLVRVAVRGLTSGTV